MAKALVPFTPDYLECVCGAYNEEVAEISCLFLLWSMMSGMNEGERAQCRTVDNRRVHEAYPSIVLLG